MRASSKASLARATVALDQELGRVAEADGRQVAEELLQLNHMTSTSGRLSRCLTDPARTPEDKRQLVGQLFGTGFTSAVANAMANLAGGRWSDENDLPDALRLLAHHVLLKTAQDNDQLDDVERDIFAVGQLLASSRALRGALSDSFSGNVEKRVELLTSLIGQKVNPLALRLIQDAVRYSKAGRLQSNLRSIGDAAAALRNQGMATVTTAVELTPEQVERVRALLSRQRGQDVVLNVVVDPTLIGGMKIRYGDSLIDGSIAKRINVTRRQLAS